ncbi:MAG: LysM peptidoglycan-binding domain-containing protein, partial [bacterium]|nr:LysM peptidoglycan-binding domain-containing protein [bacterium]
MGNGLDNTITRKGATSCALTHTRLVRGTKIYILSLLLLIFALAGCNLEAEAEAPPLATPTAAIVALPSLQSLPTTPTVPAVPTVGAGGNCVVNNTLPTYVVKDGDTLYDIAVRANTTIDNLVALNCLANANQIFSGQTLYTPQLIDAPTARYMLVLPNDNGASGLLLGCNDSAVPINSGLELTGVTQSDIQTSLTALFTASQIPSPYVTSLPRGLSVSNVTVSGDLATVALTGTLQPVGTCADARIQG